MRISDWSSDVCSSDLITNVNEDASAVAYLASRSDISVFDGAALNDNWVPPGEAAPVHTAMTFRLDGLASIQYKTPDATVYVAPLLAGELVAMAGLQSGELFAWNVRQTLGKRSEEHTSELQSLMRISYAVFCLKKKNISK